MRITENDIKRFWAKVDRSGDCWEWTVSKFKQGYGQFKISKKLYLAHRVSWTLTHRYCPIPPGMCVLHSCDNPGCVNPRHLFLGTHTDNMRDMNSKDRANKAKGENNGRAKLTAQQVLEIRSKYIPWKYSQRRLAMEYGVATPEIHRIIHRRSWTHI